MKTSIKEHSQSQVAKGSQWSAALRALLFAAIVGTLALGTARAGVLYVSGDDNKIGAYDSASGAAINASLVTGLNAPYSLAVGGGNIYVGNIGTGGLLKYTTAGAMVASPLIPFAGGIGLGISGNSLYTTRPQAADKIGEYNATTGAAINDTLVTGLSTPQAFTLDGLGHMYVVNDGAGTIGKYNTDGSVVNASLVTGLVATGTFYGLVLDNSGNLYVSCFYNGVIGKYNATTGAAVNASFLTLPGAAGLAFDQGTLYVAQYVSGKISSYDAATGAAINANLVTGLAGPVGLAIEVIPEPGMLGLLSLSAMWMISKRRKA